MIITTANGKLPETKSAFYLKREKQSINWSKEYRSTTDKYQFDTKAMTIRIVSETENGITFKQHKAVNLIPFFNKFETNNFGLEELEDNFYKIVPLKPRKFAVPSTKAQAALKEYQAKKVVETV